MEKEKIKDVLLLAIFSITGLLFYPSGIMKYVILCALAVALLIYKREIKLEYNVILLHVLTYIAIGLIFSIINRYFTSNSIKQILIFLSSGFIAISYFSFYGEENTKKFLDFQLYGVCIGYTILYLINHKGSSFTWESHVYAFVFGFFALVFICQKRYLQAFISLAYMIIDNKRVADLAFLVSLVIVLVFVFIQNDDYRRIIYRILKVIFVLIPIAWIYIVYSHALTDVFGITDDFTTLRLSIWNAIEKYYEFSPLYFGKGIGWILDRMHIDNILQLNNLHNDFLMAYIELGFFGYMIWLLSFVYMLITIEKNNGLDYAFILIAFFTYMFVNFLTDNIYIYISFLLPFYNVLLSLLFGKDNEIFIKILKQKKTIE